MRAAQSGPSHLPKAPLPNAITLRFVVSVVQSLSRVQLFATPWPAACQAPLSFTISWFKIMSIESVMPSNHLILCCPLLLPSIFPNFRVFSNELALYIGGWSIGASASVLPLNIQGWFPLGLTGLISLQPKDSQEPSPAPQFESIISSVLSLLCGPILTSVHDYWKSHGSDYMDILLAKGCLHFLRRHLGLW